MSEGTSGVWRLAIIEMDTGSFLFSPWAGLPFEPLVAAGAELPPQPANTDKAVTIARMVLAFLLHLLTSVLNLNRD